MTMVDRRRFLQALGAGSLTAAAGTTAYLALDDPRSGGEPGTSTTTTPPGTPADTSGEESTASVADRSRVLVLVELNGGNDAINTLVPDVGSYYDARPALAIDESEVVRCDGLHGYGLHPALGPLDDFWSQGQLAVLAGVGFEGASRSHFEALDWWWSGSDRPQTTGWLGRYLDATDDGSENPLRAVGLGSRSPALAATGVIATIIDRPATFWYRPPRGTDAALLERAYLRLASPASADPWKAEVQEALLRTHDAVGLFADLADGQPDAEPAAVLQRQSFASMMGTAGELIAADLGTEVVTVSMSGFDTHANQLTSHAALLADLAAGLSSLFGRLEAAGRRDDVLVMTTSEFGRRVHENGSAGTDHGRAGVQFVIGSDVVGGLRGQLDLGRLDDGDLVPSIDVRSLYRGALEWLGVDSAELLGGEWDDLELTA